MKVTIKKLTDLELLHRANSFTTGHESKMSLDTAYKYGHSPIRTQIFWIECENIPLFVASQLVRSHVGVQFFQQSKRPDRGGADFSYVCDSLAEKIEGAADSLSLNEALSDLRSLWRKFDRYTPTNLAFIINAEALINMAHKRLCAKASLETQKLMKMIKAEISNIDPALSPYLVPMCAYRNGVCSEPNPCKKRSI